MFNRFQPLAPEVVEELKNRYLAGEKHVVIQAEMGISRDTIWKYIHKLRLPMRQPWQSKRVRRHDARTQNETSDQQATEQT